MEIIMTSLRGQHVDVLACHISFLDGTPGFCAHYDGQEHYFHSMDELLLWAIKQDVYIQIFEENSGQQMPYLPES